MTSPVDTEKAEGSQPLLAEVSSNDTIGASNMPETNNNWRWSLFFLIYTVCLLLLLYSLSGNIGFNRSYSSPVEDNHVDGGSMQCHDSVNFTIVTTPWSAGGYVHHAHTSTSLPIFSEELSFVALGDLSHGTFQISQSLGVGSEAVVDVTVLYQRLEVLDDVTICRLHPSEGEWGLGILTPKRSGAEREHEIQVHINVLLPASVDPRKSLAVKRLRTYLPQYTHVIPDLLESVHFDRVDLTSDDGGIAAEGLRADTITVQSRSGPITGTYNATTMLALNTANAPIAVRANLLGGSDRVIPLFLITSNSFIDSQIGLYSNTSDSTGGAFTVSARTSNSPLKLVFVDAPVDSILFVAAGTSNSPAQVRLHETYEGSFMLRGSTFFPPTVEWREGVQDPAGHGRERTVETKIINDSLVTGDVFWGEKAKKAGSVQWFEASNAPLRLALQRGQGSRGF